MEKVLSITARLEDKRRKQQVEAYRDKFEAVQRVLQCSACNFKCTMCGCHKKGTESSGPPSTGSIESTLCESCRSEFETFQKKSKEDRKGPDIFWHNDEPKIHFHGAFGKKEMVKIGCLREKAETFLVLEAVIIEMEGIHATREVDPEIGMALLKL